MTDAIQDRLQQAFELIRQNQLEEARAILQPVLMSQPSADSWWLWANAVTNPEDARHALTKVLDFEPNHQLARQQLEKLNQLYPPLPEVEAEVFDYGIPAATELESTAPAPVTEPDFLATAPAESAADMRFDDTAADLFIHSFERDVEMGRGELAEVETGEWPAELAAEAAAGVSPEQPAAVAPQRRPALRRVLLALLVIVVIAGGVLLALNYRQPQPQGLATNTMMAAQTILEPSGAVQRVLEAAQAAAKAAAAQLGGPAAVSYELRDNVPTLLVRVCRPAGLDVPAALDRAMDLAARYGVSAQDEIAAVGAMLINCDRDDTLVGALASMDSAAAYAGQALEQAAFRATWLLVN